MNVHVITAILALVFTFGCTSRTSNDAPKPVPCAAKKDLAILKSKADITPDANGLSKAVVSVKTSKGTIKFKLYSKDAPNTIARFADLISSGYYNGLAFHRVVPGFVIQTGDPCSVNMNDPAIGTGGTGQKLKAEFNSRKHVRGTVAMARASDPDSADTQFYISLGTFPHLDNHYTVIGQVIDTGEKVLEKDILDRIVVGDKVEEIKIE